MIVYGYVSVSTNASKTTALNGSDICEDANCSGSTPHFENYEKLQISAGNTSASKNFYFYVDDRYEDAELVTFVLETFTAAEVSGINYNSYPGAAGGSGAPPASNATTDGDEEFAVTISASGADERPVVEWVDNSSGSVPYSASSGTRTINENAGTGYFTLQLSKFSEKAITVNYSLLTTETNSNPPTLIATGHASTNTYPIDYTHWGSGSDGTGSSSALSSEAGSVTFTAVGDADNADADRQYINIPVTLIDDGINEWSESVVLKNDESGNDDVTGTAM
jgi:hypothetical protein